MKSKKSKPLTALLALASTTVAAATATASSFHDVDENEEGLPTASVAVDDESLTTPHHRVAANANANTQLTRYYQKNTTRNNNGQKRIVLQKTNENQKNENNSYQNNNNNNGKASRTRKNKPATHHHSRRLAQQKTHKRNRNINNRQYNNPNAASLVSHQKTSGAGQSAQQFAQYQSAYTGTGTGTATGNSHSISNHHPFQAYNSVARSSSNSNASASASAPGCGPTPGTHHSPYLGCYRDKKNDRALPFELHSNSSRGKRLNHGVLDCERECSIRGYRYFAREYRGQCFCGNNLIESVVRHGRVSRGGCDCCGGNVGAGKMCLWENANHEDSNAQLPNIPVALPHQSQSHQISTVAIQPMHAHLETSSTPHNNNKHNPSSNHNAPADKKDKNNNVDAVATRKPTGAFRLRLHWQPGYNWQNDRTEQFWCMECRGSCKSGSSIQIDKCLANNNNNHSSHRDSIRQQFIAIAKTIRPAANPSLCLTISGYNNGAHDPIILRRCVRGGSSSQNFKEIKAVGKFELQPENKLGVRCLSQHHHPKEYEAVFPEFCERTRKYDTTYWRVY